MRLRAAIEPLASTRKRSRFPSRPSLMFSRRSEGRTTRLVPSRARSLWCGAAARIVAASATSLDLPGFSRSATGCPVSPETRLLRPSGPPLPFSGASSRTGSNGSEAAWLRSPAPVRISEGSGSRTSGEPSPPSSLLEGGISPPSGPSGGSGGSSERAFSSSSGSMPGCSKGPRLRRYEVTAQAVDAEFRAEGRDPEQDILIQTHLRKPHAGRFYGRGELPIHGRPFSGERTWIFFVAQAASYDFDPIHGLGIPGDFDRDAETVQELGTKITLLGVHRADQDEAGRVAHAHTFALDVVHTHRGNVEEQIHQVVGEQVDLVHVQDAPVRRCQQPRLERFPPLRERLLDIQGPGETIRARPHGQFHQPDRPRLGGCVERVWTRRAFGVGGGRIAGVGTARYDLDLWQ